MHSSVPVILASAALLLTGCSHHASAAAEAGATTSVPSSTPAATSGSHGVPNGTYSTAALSPAQLIRAGLKPKEVQGTKTVLLLKLQHGAYSQFSAEDGGAPELGDTGSYSVHRHTMTFVSSFQSERTTYLLHRTNDGFRLHVKHFYFSDPTDRRIATVIWGSVPFHRA